MTTAAELMRDLTDARTRTLALIDDLPDDALEVPLLRIVNPPLWEIGHVAWFQEFWTLRHLGGRQALIDHADQLFDSAAVYHDSRWALRLPSRAETAAYMRAVHADMCARLERTAIDARELYFHRLVTLHEDMHGEALVYTRQTLGLPRPQSAARSGLESRSAGSCPGDAAIPGGEFMLGATRDTPFVFDNEKWAHPVPVEPFRIARAAVTQAEFAEFVDAGGYRRDEWWSVAGRAWREAHAAEHPVHWRRDAGGLWLRVHFDEAVPLEEHKPVVHVSWYEAEAWCAFAGRRLPTELEWEVAAAGRAEHNGRLAAEKRRFPWGAAAPSAELANLELTHDGPCDVGAFERGDSAFGCRQMIGNVWEWTATDFQPYAEFTIDPYKEYSAPWFGDHKVLRGGCFATRARLIRNTWRNFYTPDRRDILAGFRTCAR